MSTPITTVTELQAMTVAGDYILSNNIDASETSTWNGGLGFLPIGTYSVPFTGTFNGAGYTISSLFISRNLDDIGLFGAVIGGTVQNVNLTNVNITGLTGTTDEVGALAGWVETSTITSCTSSGTVTGQYTGVQVGGLIGYLWSGTVSKCSSTCAVAVNAWYGEAGGFAGDIYNASVDQCYATGAVTETVGDNYLGGFVSYVGWGTGITPSITNCYARGAAHDGGFCYYLNKGTIDNCYSTGVVTTASSGFVNTKSVGTTLTDSYWDITTSGQSASAGGTGKTTAQMKVQLTYSGWDFTTIWMMDSITNDGYPYFGTGRCFIIPDLFDWKGRVAKGARVRAYRDDTHELIKEGLIDQYGNATICGLPNDTDVSFHVTWGGSSTSGDERWFYSKIGAVAEGGTGSSLAPTARTNLGLAIGTNVQAWNNNLDDIAALTPTDSNIMVGNGTDWVAESGATARTSLGVGTADSPQFAAVNVGAATDTTVARASAGDIKIEENIVYRAGGTDVPVTDGGTGASTAAAAASNLGVGTEDSPQFTGIELGHASDTTLARDAAGIVSIEGKRITRSAAYVIAANDSEIKTQADYVCDGTNDHLDIQAAIDALPATGGEIQLLDGTYNIEVALVLDSYQALRGCGRSTILTTTTLNLDLIIVTGGSGTEKVGINISDLCINGTAGGTTIHCGIIWIYVDNSRIDNVWVQNCGQQGLRMDTSDGNIIINSTFSGCTSHGIYAYQSNYGVFRGNVCQGNSAGIQVSESNYAVIAENNCGAGNTYGIYLDASNYTTVGTNVCIANDYYGIYSDGGDNNVISGNVIYQSGRNGIEVISDNTVVANNFISASSQTTTNTYSDIFSQGSKYSTIQGNICRAGALTNKPKYGIDIATAGDTSNTVIDNDLYDDGFVTAPLHDVGTGTIVVLADIDDTPVNGATTTPVSSNWAYDHNALSVGVHGIPADPGADRVLTWDDSESALAWTAAGAGDFKADGSVPLTGDIDFAGTQQCHDLQAPAAAGEAIRQTAKITEAILEGLNDNALVHADVDDTPVNGETTVPISSNWAYDLITNLFTPIAGEIIRQSVTSKCPSPFSALINGTPNATTVVYDTDTNEASVAGLYSGAGYWGRIMLYNSAKGTYRKIVSVEISTNTITTESSTDTWANDDAITTQSQTNTEAGYFDLDLSTNIPASATVLNVSTLYRDLDKSAYDADRSLIVHPYVTYDDAKRYTTCASVIGEQSTLCFFVPVISQKITVYYRGAANTMLIILMVKGYY